MLHRRTTLAVVMWALTNIVYAPCLLTTDDSKTREYVCLSVYLSVSEISTTSLERTWSVELPFAWKPLRERKGRKDHKRSSLVLSWNGRSDLSMPQATPTQSHQSDISGLDVDSNSDPPLALASKRALTGRGRGQSTTFLTLTVTRSSGVQVTTIQLGNGGQQADPVPANTINPTPPTPPPAADSNDGGTSEGTVIIVVVVLFILFLLFTTCCLCRTRRKGGGSYVSLCGLGGPPGRRGPRGIPVGYPFSLLFYPLLFLSVHATFPGCDVMRRKPTD